MKTLLLKRDCRNAARGLEGKFSAPAHVCEKIDEETTVKAPGGRTIAVFLPSVIPVRLYKLSYELWKIVKELPSNRATAVGSRSLPRLRKDGSIGERRGVTRSVLISLKRQGTANGSLGYLDATPNQRCHKTPISRRHPEMLNGNRSLITLVDKFYRQYATESYAKQRAELEKVPLWRLWGTVFTTIYLAKNFRTAYHRDSGNLKGVMTALTPMGKFTGGELVFPRWRIAFVLKPGDLLFFDPQQLHGNLPFEGERLSAAFYCERRIAHCAKVETPLQCVRATSHRDIRVV